MKKIACLLVLLGLLCASCATTKTDAAAPAAADSAAASDQEKEWNLPSVYEADLPYVQVDKAKLEAQEIITIELEYPVFHQDAMDAAILRWAHNNLERMQSEYKTALEENRFEPTEDMTQEEIDAGFARQREEETHYYYGITFSVLDFDPERGASILFQEDSFFGGPHGALEYRALTIDANGNVVEPWSAFPSPEAGLKTLSDACREQFSHTDLVKDVYMEGTEPTLANFKDILRVGDNLYIFFQPYTVGGWAEGPQLCTYSLK